MANKIELNQIQMEYRPLAGAADTPAKVDIKTAGLRVWERFIGNHPGYGLLFTPMEELPEYVKAVLQALYNNDPTESNSKVFYHKLLENFKLWKSDETTLPIDEDVRFLVKYHLKTGTALSTERFALDVVEAILCGSKKRILQALWTRFRTNFVQSEAPLPEKLGERMVEVALESQDTLVLNHLRSLGISFKGNRFQKIIRRMFTNSENVKPEMRRFLKKNLHIAFADRADTPDERIN